MIDRGLCSELQRTSRASRSGFVDHVLNRGNGDSDVFHRDEDFAAIVNLMREAHKKVPMGLTSLCLMTNHFHLPLSLHENGDLSRRMLWIMTSHGRRYHRHSKGCGHVWQRRFIAFPVQSDGHSLAMRCYVERNPLRANMFHRSQDWQWFSLKPSGRSGPTGPLHDDPVRKSA